MSMKFTMAGFAAELKETLDQAREMTGSPLLNLAVAEAWRDGADLHDDEGTRWVPGIAQYITENGKNRHATARRLGAEPTNAYEATASGIETVSDDAGGGIVITEGVPEVFCNTFEDVLITPAPGKQWLTIPNVAAAYGKRAGEFGDTLQFQPRGTKLGVLVKRLVQSFGVLKRQARKFPVLARTAAQAKTAKRASTRAAFDETEKQPVIYWCVKQVLLKMDRTKLPADQVLFDLAAAGAWNAVEAHLKLKQEQASLA